MATAVGIIFQYEATNALADAYTVPALTSHVVSTINLCNFSGGTETITLKMAKGGVADSNEQFIFSNLSLVTGMTVQDTAGMNISAGDIIRVIASNNNVISVNFFGTIIT
jgi:hypothetical protein